MVCTVFADWSPRSQDGKQQSARMCMIVSLLVLVLGLGLGFGLILVLVVLLLLALQSLVNFSPFQKCLLLFSVLLLTSPVSHTHLL